ncbi:MAG TPA: GNAT family N-acetyltransferase [Gaiellaceae bacterium]|jgi:GNAT superfamily N-acetyltransferase
MVAESLLQLFDAQVRPQATYSSPNWSAVLRPPEDGDVAPLIAWMREQPGYVEWKYYSHDRPPDLPDRLRAAGLVPEDEETVVVAEAASIPPPPADVELTLATDAFIDLAARVFGGDRHGLPESTVAVVALVDGVPVSGGRVDFEPGVEFAGLFGGVTLPEFRGRGLYRATVAKRAELARERGYRWLYSDALPTSRPILERVGFVRLTTTTPYVFASRDPAASTTD